MGAHWGNVRVRLGSYWDNGNKMKTTILWFSRV